MTPARRHVRGFTLIELVITLGLVGVLAMAALPLVEITYARMKESELRVALRTIRGALDQYRAAYDSGLLPRVAGQSGFPATLDALAEPLTLNAGAGGRDDAPRTLVILRRIPRDPFHTDPSVPAALTWRTRAYGSRPDEWSDTGGIDVFDISSRSSAKALDGSRYDTW